MNIFRSTFAPLATAAALLGAGHSTAEVDTMVVFGDSLSDPGNYFQLYGEQSIQPFEPDNIPSAPYARGGHHFSNGETWIEQLTRDTLTASAGSPATVAPGVFSNYAVGRSRARAEYLEGVFIEQTFTSQVDRFLADHDGSASEESLYTVWIGSNDVADALGAFLTVNPGAAMDIINAGVTNTATQLTRLYLAGARQFLVVYVPDFSLTPRVSGIADAICADNLTCRSHIVAQVSMVSTAYNGGLAQALSLMAPLPGISVQTLDVSAFLEDVAADPQSHGFTNATDSCISPDTVQQTFCTSPDQYLFWDGQHPTRAGHTALANYARQQLNLN